jgi:predicted RND superfamily exporter protein
VKHLFVVKRAGAIIIPFSHKSHTLFRSSFPFLNFIGIFVAAALGADDVFVAVDKWKNARLDNPSASTQEIAAIALPDAASAMLLTTSTTAVAFFATMICPVTPIFCFAFFCGLLIMFNYFLNVIFVFPALCLYDIWLMNGSTNCLINCGCGSKSKVEDPVDEGAATKKSPIHKILSTYFYFLEKFRFFIIAASIAALATCIVVAATVSKKVYF